jgi:hypothetical protein
MTRKLLPSSTSQPSLRTQTRTSRRSAGRSRRPPGLGKVKPLTDGFILLTPAGIETAFAQDLTKEKALLVAVQPQTAGPIFEAKPSAAAWHSKPSWFIVASNDNMIAPEQEKSMAKQIGAITVVLPSSHVAMLSHPKEVANVIEDGVPAHSDRKHFEGLVLSGAQAGLNWSLVLKKREGYRRAFEKIRSRESRALFRKTNSNTLSRYRNHPQPLEDRRCGAQRACIAEGPGRVRRL